MSAAHLAARVAAALQANRPLGPVLEALGIDPSVRAEVAGGEPVGDALARAGLLPWIYAFAFEAGRPDVATAIAHAQRHAQNQKRRFVTVARGGVLLALATGFAVGVGVVFGLEPLREGIPHTALMGALDLLFSPPFALGAVLLAVLAGLGMGRLWRFTPGGARSLRALTTRSFALLLSAGLSAERAAQAAGDAFGAAAMRTASTRMSGGVEPGAALVTARMAPKGCDHLWSATDGHGCAALSQVADGLATALEAEAAALAPTLGRGLWGLFTVLAGALTVAYGTAMVQAWVELMRWPG